MGYEFCSNDTFREFSIHNFLRGQAFFFEKHFTMRHYLPQWLYLPSSQWLTMEKQTPGSQAKSSCDQQYCQRRFFNCSAIFSIEGILKYSEIHFLYQYEQINASLGP